MTLVRRPETDLEAPEAVPPEETALARPRPSVSDFLRRLADDIDAQRSTVVARDHAFQKMRIIGPNYDLFIGRFDPDRHRF